jgi:hypothetical protein
MLQYSNVRDGVLGSLVEEAPSSSEAHLGPKQEVKVALDQDALQSDGLWKATTQIQLILICLAIVSIVVALDATILVATLPVSNGVLCTSHAKKADCSRLDARDCTEGHRQRDLLGWIGVSSY